MWANVDTGLANTLAEGLGVNPAKGSHVSVDISYPSLSQFNTPYLAATQRVGVLIGNGFNGQEVKNVLRFLEENGVFVQLISENLGAVTPADGTKVKVDETFLTKYPVLYDALYVVGGSAENQAKLNQDIAGFIQEAYKHYKPIGVATTGNGFINRSKNNNLAGVVFATDNPDFRKDFVAAIAKQRFWDRT